MLFKNIKTPSENYLQQIRFFRRACQLSGVDLLDVNFRISWRTNILFGGVTIYFIFVFLTIYNNYKDDWTIILRATVTMGTAIQGLFKLVSFIMNHNIIIYVTQLLEKCYKEYETKGNKYCDALNATNAKTKKALYTITILYGVGYSGMIAVPYVLYAMTGGRNLIIEFHIPYLDVKTYFGYFATLVFQSVLMIAFAVGLYCGDLGAMMILAQAFMFSGIFEAKVEYINEMIEDPENSKKPKVTEVLKDIIQWHQVYGDFTNQCNNIFYYVITVQIMTAFSSTILCIYLTIAGGWPSSYSYAVVAFSSLHLYCIMGTQSEIANEHFEHTIYNLNWYNLTVPQQKLVLQVLIKAQSAETIDVAGVMPLSVSTGLQLTKTIYTIAMMMIEFFLE